MHYAGYVFGKTLEDIDPTIAGIVEFEEARQARKIILIPSESICPAPVLRALGSSFNNVYAEGYPSRFMEGEDEPTLADIDFQLTRYRRYADRRFYKGCEYADLVEKIAARRAAQLFRTRKNSPENIFINVQPLSGSIAVSAVYDAFVQPGETVMGMSLMHGGHLTHGSEFNRSGKQHRIVSYEVDPVSGRLDYSRIIDLAATHRPRMIIAGYTSYPWAPDWKKFRKAADSAGAILLADISHPAGMVTAGVYPNPVDYADVVVFTTHKTLFGPRGAVIMTTNREYAERIDQAVFPGEQGGPHVNKFAAMAVAFGIAGSSAFKKVQKDIVENAHFLGQVLERNGLKLAYGGTDTHLLLLDLNSVETKSGFPLKGEIAVRILDLCGIVANKNTIPGDTATAEASGVRIGTPWITQRGITRTGLEELGVLIAKTIKNIQPFTYRGITGDLPRGKIDLDLLVDIQSRVASLAGSLEKQKDAAVMGYPQYGLQSAKETADSAHHFCSILIKGERSPLFLEGVSTRAISTSIQGNAVETFLLGGDGTLISQAVVVRLSPDKRGKDRFLLVCPGETCQKVLTWLRGLSDGYIAFDPRDIFRKIDGPVVIREHDECSEDEKHEIEGMLETISPHLKIEQKIKGKNSSSFKPGAESQELYRQRPDCFDVSKPYFIGMHALGRAAKNTGKKIFRPAEVLHNKPGAGKQGAKPSCLYAEHLKLRAHMVAFAGWEMPVRYERIIDEHRAVRQNAGLFDISHMGILEVSGRFSTQFLDTVYSNYVPWIKTGESMYGYLLDPDGHTIDDIMIYKLGHERYIVVVNAANSDVDIRWLNAVNEKAVCIDADVPVREIIGDVVIRNLKDIQAVGSDARVGMALQGPASLKALCALTDAVGTQISRLEKSTFIQCEIGGCDVLVSRTGYTGEEIGYEIMVHPDSASLLWNSLLDVGRPYGVKPAGLGARDSLRIEAGLPLHGHELAGPWDITPLEAGFGPYVKFHKAFFIGRDAFLQRMKKSTMEVVRFKVRTRGVRMAKTGDCVVEIRSQRIIGRVTSCAQGTDELQVGMAYIDTRFSREGTLIGIISAFSENEKTVSGKIGEKYHLHIDAGIISRFP